MKLLKKISLGVVVLFIAAQFYRPAKNIASGPSANDITAHYPTSPDVKQLLSVACYDCHSNTTHYPWYANIQPVSSWLASHVEDGKKHLNFSEFASYTPKRAANKLGEVVDEVTDREMPLFSYRLGHADARLTPAQIKLLTDWAGSVRTHIMTANGLTED
ncbi:MAG: heme-binding domain-containing protein [Opitutaceae bacterium]